MYKVKTPSVVISELFRWWLWHLGPDAGFLLTLGHVSRSYRSKGTVARPRQSPHLRTRAGGEPGRAGHLSVYVHNQTSKTGLWGWMWWKKMDRGPFSFSCPNPCACSLTTAAVFRWAHHPTGPPNLPLFQAQRRSMSCWNGSSRRAVSLNALVCARECC